MALHRRRPAPPIAQFVQSLYVFEGSPQAHARERALPDGCAQLIINLARNRTTVYDRLDAGKRQCISGSLMVGPQTEYCIIDPGELLSVAGVHFRAGGAAAFVAFPMQELHASHVPLDALWGSFATELRDRLLEADSTEERLDLLETALLSHLLQRATTSPLDSRSAVRFALRKFAERPHLASVSTVIGQTGFSKRHFIDLFRREVGFTPKLFCRVHRFQRALQRLSRDRAVEWADVALEVGYFDQAHFIHDFAAFSGINPSTYRRLRPIHPNHVPLAANS